jgi:tetratricopeptide (TPR) repeat protein
VPDERSATTTALDEARLLAAQGEWSASLRAADTVLEAEPTHLPALLLKAGVLLQSRKEDEALSHFERATALSPQSAEAENGLARCLHSMGRNEEALVRARHARELLKQPDNFAQTAPVYLTLLWVHRDMRQYKEALAAAEEGLSRCADAVLAQWASVVEEELEQAQQDRC